MMTLNFSSYYPNSKMLGSKKCVIIVALVTVYPQGQVIWWHIYKEIVF